MEVWDVWEADWDALVVRGEAALKSMMSPHQNCLLLEGEEAALEQNRLRLVSSARERPSLVAECR